MARHRNHQHKAPSKASAKIPKPEPEPEPPAETKPKKTKMPPGGFPDDEGSDSGASSACEESPSSPASGPEAEPAPEVPVTQLSTKKQQLELYTSQAQRDNEAQSPRHLISAIAAGNKRAFDVILKTIDPPALTAHYTTELRWVSELTWESFRSLTRQLAAMYVPKSCSPETSAAAAAAGQRPSIEEPRFRDSKDAIVFSQALAAGPNSSDEIDKSHAVLRVLALLCRESQDGDDKETDKKNSGDERKRGDDDDDDSSSSGSDNESDSESDSDSDSENENENEGENENESESETSVKEESMLKDTYKEMLEKVLRKYHQNNIAVPAELFLFYYKVLGQCGFFLERIWRHNIALADAVPSAETNWQNEKHCETLKSILEAILARGEGGEDSDDKFEEDYGPLVRFLCLFNNGKNKRFSPWKVVTRLAMEKKKPEMLKYALRQGLASSQRRDKHTKSLLKKAIATGDGFAVGEIILFIRGWQDSEKEFRKVMREMFERS